MAHWDFTFSPEQEGYNYVNLNFDFSEEGTYTEILEYFNAFMAALGYQIPTK